MIGRFKLTLVVVLAVCLGFSGAAWAGPFGFSLEAAAGVWLTNADGKTADGGETLDFKSTFDLESQTGFSAWARFEHPVPFLPDLKLEFFHTAPSGRSNVNASFRFGDQVFTTGTVLDSDLTMNITDLTLYWHVPLAQTVSAGVFDITFGLTGRLVSGDVALKGKFPGMNAVEAKDDFLFLLPMGHVGLRVWPIEWLSFEGAAEAMGWNGQYWWDFYAAAHVSPWTRNFFFGVGYRNSAVDVDELIDMKLDTGISGVFFEAGFRI